jgi:hypothetical protein
MKKISIFLLILCGFATAVAQERYVMPVDEAKKDPSFFEFREKFIAAAERRDGAFILSILDPKIELSFGGDAGIADFKRMWKITAKNSGFWEEFLPVIKNGGSFSGQGSERGFFAPYTFSNFPEDLDAFEYRVIFGSNVNLRERPDVSAPIVASLSYNVVKVLTENPGGRDAWEKVKTLGGKVGYVKAEFARSPVDYRAGFMKRRGVWKLTVFIAGD